ncbi:glycosyltransferase family 4 protein [Ferrimicrobium sp.]|uniref:glycosyltransferase family 4 protein n=1 Tax=Ferrimicrobium sp. TaxID=2926050 RepID=UPI00262AC876|nr:glycosyltransferase family 4 protein [Ferrimicrobium sp.]
MRIVEISPYDLSAVGGVQAQVVGLAGVLRSLGAEVQVIAPGMTEGVDASLGRVSRWRANGSVAPVALIPRMSQVAPILRSADIIHLHEPLAPMGGIAILRWVHDHGALDRLWVTFHRDGVSKGYQQWSRWWSYLLPPDHQVAVSPFAAHTAQLVSGVYPLEIPNGVAFDGGGHWRHDEVAMGDRRQRSILFVGRHEERKGLEVALQSFAALDAAVELIVVGTGPLTERLKTRYPDHRIHWLGRVDEATLNGLYRSVDVVVAPSLEGESFGVVLLEAMANGAALVVSDIPAYRWLSADGYAADLVPPGDADALAMALTTLLADSLRRNALRARGFERVRSFAFTTIAERYLTLFSGS